MAHILIVMNKTILCGKPERSLYWELSEDPNVLDPSDGSFVADLILKVGDTEKIITSTHGASNRASSERLEKIRGLWASKFGI